MNLSRRGFLSGLAAALAAPAVIRVAELMPVKVWRPILVGDGIADDTEALQAFINAAYEKGDFSLYLPRGSYRTTATVHFPPFALVSGQGSALLYDFDLDAGYGFGEMPTGKKYVAMFHADLKDPHTQRVVRDISVFPAEKRAA